MTYQNYHVNNGIETTPFESNKFLYVLFTALFITAAFVVPTIGLIDFLFH